MGFTYDVRIAGPGGSVRTQNNRANEAYAASTAVSPLPSGRTAYRTLADYNADMAKLAKNRPGVARTFTLKRPSLDGRPVRAIEIAGDVKARNDGRPTFALLGVHHAREWPSGELAMEFAVDLVKSYGRSERITDLLDRARVVVVPVVNVDGFELSRTDGGLVDLREVDGGGTGTILGTPGNAYKRKNCRVVDGQDTPDGTCRAASLTSPGGYGIGVDLNRNYGGFWGGPGASATFADPTYRGAKAFSEPETLNVRDLVSKPAGHHADLQPHLLQPGAAPQRGAPRHHRPRRPPRRRRARRGGAEAARGEDDGAERLPRTSTAGSSTTPPAPPRTGPTTPPAASATPSRSGPTSSTRRSPRSSTSTSAPASTPARATVRPT